LADTDFKRRTVRWLDRFRKDLDRKWAGRTLQPRER
jgi:hypothetical protein